MFPAELGFDRDRYVLSPVFKNFYEFKHFSPDGFACPESYESFHGSRRSPIRGKEGEAKPCKDSEVVLDEGTEIAFIVADGPSKDFEPSRIVQMCQTSEASRDLLLGFIRRWSRKSGSTPERHPGPTVSVEVARLDDCFVKKLSQADVAAKVSQARRETLKGRSNGLRHVLQDQLSCDPVQLHRTARRKVREALFDLPLQYSPGSPG